MSFLKRWDLVYHSGEGCECGMDPDSSGEYVEYKEAAAEIELLTAENSELKRCLDGGVDCAAERMRLTAELNLYTATDRQKTAEINALVPEVKAITAERDALRVNVKDYEDSYRQTIEGQCSPDEVHCTCVPALRQEITTLRDKYDSADGMLASLADCVASALRNSGMSDAGIGLGTDLRDHIWRLSYKIIEYRIKNDVNAAIAKHVET